MNMKDNVDSMKYRPQVREGTEHEVQPRMFMVLSTHAVREDKNQSRNRLNNLFLFGRRG